MLRIDHRPFSPRTLRSTHRISGGLLALLVLRIQCIGSDGASWDLNLPENSFSRPPFGGSPLAGEVSGGSQDSRATINLS